MHKLRASAVLHILDDFLFVAPSAEKCEADLANFLRLCNYLGVPIAHEKTVQPRTTLEFAGITLDSIFQEPRLPPDIASKMSHVASSISQTSNSYPSGASVPYRSFKFCVFCHSSRPRFPSSPY